MGVGGCQWMFVGRSVSWILKLPLKKETLCQEVVGTFGWEDGVENMFF